MEQITRSATAGAKINLFLSIGARRADGYHEIDTVMQSLPFGDAVSLRFEAPRSGEQTVLFTTNRLFGEAEKNLGVIAVRAYCRAAGISAYRAILQIEKRIPAGAGFGGGSADAAAVLRLCKAQLGALSERAMHLLCTSIGADVPFCYAGGCFRAHGHIPLRIVCRCRRSPGRRKYSRRCTAERFRKSAMQCITDLKRRCSPRARRRLRCERLCCAAGLTAQCSAAAARGYSVYFPLRKRRQRKKRLRSCGKRDIGLSFAPWAVRKGTEPSERRETAGAFVPGGKF